MSRTVRIFIDEAPVDAPDGTPLRDVLAERDPALAIRLDAGTAYVTDGVGRRVSPGQLAAAGAIYRIVRAGRRRDS